MSLNMLSDSFVKKHFDPERYDLSMLQKHFELLCEFCDYKGFDMEQIHNDYMDREGSDDWKLEEKVNRTESEELIKRYYSTTQMYLYELTLQECRWDYKELFRSIAKFAIEKNVVFALDYGGGIGGLTIYLNRHGIKCDYADVRGQTWDYAKYRFGKERIRALQFSEDDLGQVQPSYDLITSLDCLEHLKPLPKYIKLFNHILKNNGKALVKFSFYGIGLHIKSNHKYNKLNTFNKMLQSNGFKFKGQSIMRFGRNFLIPGFALKLLNVKRSSGRKLIYTKSYAIN